MEHVECRNNIWQVIVSLCPCNGALWPHQTGVTRKCLMATIGFAILILSSLYQAKLSEQLMIPYPPPVVTLKHIESYVASGRARLMINSEDIPTVQYLSDMSSTLKRAMQSNSTVYFNYIDEVLHEISNDAVLIDAESLALTVLSLMPESECAKYVYVTFEQWTRNYKAIIIRRERGDVLEEMNAIVVERMSYVDDFIQSSQLKEECRKHVFPVHTPDPKYLSLHLANVSGAFAFLFLFLLLACFVLSGEVFANKFYGTKQEEHFDIVIEIDSCDIQPDMHEIIFEKYLQFMQLLDNCVLS
jgi:hypothetical protein